MNDNSSTGQDVANEGVPLEENVGAESESIEDSGQQTLSVELQEVIQETQDFRKKQRGKKIVYVSVFRGCFVRRKKMKKILFLILAAAKRLSGWSFVWS